MAILLRDEGGKSGGGKKEGENRRRGEELSGRQWLEMMRGLKYAVAYWERGHPCPLSARRREKAFR
jgi:hypothetical protein